MNDQDEHFLKRWSRRKIDAKESDVAKGENADAAQHDVSRRGNDGGQADRGGAADAEATRQLTEADFADVDFAALDMQSDYSRFLASNVPDTVKYKALRQLWSTSEIFTQVDPFQDYAGDFTDAACAVPPGTLKTSYRIGRGFLSDEEVAEWEKLGVPEPEEIARAPEGAEPRETAAREDGSQAAAGEDNPAEGETAAASIAQTEEHVEDALTADAAAVPADDEGARQTPHQRAGTSRAG
jgi:hypothetical protein